jgi:hypothetical protein
VPISTRMSTPEAQSMARTPASAPTVRPSPALPRNTSAPPPPVRTSWPLRLSAVRLRPSP